MKVYFLNSFGFMREIASIPDTLSPEDVKTEAIKSIQSFCDEHNFKIYYTRCWNTDVNGVQMTKYDVGSHSEFFFTEPITFFPETQKV